MSRLLSADQTAPARAWRTITPSDSVNLPAGVRSLYINSDGDVAVVGFDDHVEVFGALAGQIIPVQAKRVNATGTTATSIIALY